VRRQRKSRAIRSSPVGLFVYGTKVNSISPLAREELLIVHSSPAASQRERSEGARTQ
jgi:hypothetical protein